MNLTKAEVTALKRVFGTEDVDRLSKGRLVDAITDHINFNDYILLELYKHNSRHEVFKELTEGQHALMKKFIAEQKHKEYMMEKEAAQGPKVGAPSIKIASSDGQ